MMKRILQVLMGNHKSLAEVAIPPKIHTSQSITVNKSSVARNVYVTKEVNPSSQQNIPLVDDPYKHLRQSAIETRLLKELLERSDEARKLGHY